MYTDDVHGVRNLIQPLQVPRPQASGALAITSTKPNNMKDNQDKKRSLADTEPAGVDEGIAGFSMTEPESKRRESYLVIVYKL